VTWRAKAAHQHQAAAAAKGIRHRAAAGGVNQRHKAEISVKCMARKAKNMTRRNKRRGEEENGEMKKASMAASWRLYSTYLCVRARGSVVENQWRRRIK